MRTSDVAVLVISCDKYSDLWKPFFEIFFKQWPDCPYPVYLGSNLLHYPDDRVTTIKTGSDTSWGGNAARMLDSIESDYVILFLEDFLITKRVITERINSLVELAEERSLGCLRLISGLPLAFPPSSRIAGLEGVGVIGKEQLYRVSAQVAIWKVATLRKLLLQGMTPWEFEEIGTEIASKFEEEFWAVYESAVSYDQFVEKGKWKPEGLDFCHKHNVIPDLSKRQHFTDDEWRQYQVSQKAAVELYDLKMNSEKNFLAGNRLHGIRGIIKYARASGNYRKAIGVAMMGVAGAWLLLLARSMKCRYRLVKLRSRASRLRTTT